MDNTNKTINAVSLFAGFGGLETGVRAAIPNMRIVAYVEREAYALALLAQKIKDGVLDEAILWPDITTFPAKELAEEIPIHLVLAGYPCQDFSCAGKRAGLGGDRGKMWGYTRSVLNGCNAPAFIGENVGGHLSLGFDSVISDLAEDGYRVDAGIQSASSVGLPHLRKRVFSFAIKTDIREWGIREPDELIQACRESNRKHELRNSTSKGLERATREEFQGGSDGLTSDDRKGLVGDKVTKPCDERGGEGKGQIRSDGNVLGGGGDSTEYVSNSESSRQGGELGEFSRHDEQGIQDDKRKVRTSVRSNVEPSSECTGEQKMGDSMCGGQSRRESGSMGEKTGEENEGGDKPTRETRYTSEEDREGADYALTLAKLYDDGFPSTKYGEDGRPYIDLKGFMGDSKHNGSSAESKLRSNEESSSTRREEEQEQAIKPERTDRSIDVPSIRGCEEGSKQMGDSKYNGSSTTERGGSIEEEQGERRMQESQGRCEFHPVRFPAGPGSDKYDWEPQRTEEAGTQPFMGREFDDVTDGLHVNQIRQDRLRLCGNGVVWLTAARAISEIYIKHKTWLTGFLNSDQN
jgi:DNA (cytosine-5)-methyltransferase 1